MGLNQKILLLTGLLVVALLATTLAFTTVQADRLAHATVRQGLAESRQVWETFQEDRFDTLKLGVRVLANDPAFKAAVETGDAATIADTLRERGQDISADFFLATDPYGIVVARSDRPADRGQDLSGDPLVSGPLEGGEAATVWRQGDRLFQAVAVPMQTGADLKGVLVAGYAIDEELAGEIRKLTRSETAFLVRAPGREPRLAVSSLGPREDRLRAALAALPAAAPEPFDLDLGGEAHMAVAAPLRDAGGQEVGSLLALRSLQEEMASFRQFRKSLLLASLAVMAVGLALSYLTASRITGPVRRLVSLVERARDGSYSGKVSVDTRDEIGVLARAFNNLLADLREKEELIRFLREGMTMLKRGPGVTGEAPTLPTGRTVSSPETALTTGNLFDGRYEVLGALGSGGMGVVYRARDRQLDEIVALKVVRTEVLREDPGQLDRIKQEIRLARRVTHRNVLRTHDFGEVDGTPYISMEYLEGVTLKDLLRSKGALPLGVGLRVAKQICQGLEAAHHEGVIHRDVKPHNVLILPESGELKIMDFGIARVVEMKAGESGLTPSGTVTGTPDYMPPEQAHGLPADFRSDVYSLGVVLYEVFTGRLPFTGETAMSVILQHIRSLPSPPRTANPAVPEELETLILRCMEKEPERRPQRVAEVLARLTAVSSRLESAAA